MNDQTQPVAIKNREVVSTTVNVAATGPSREPINTDPTVTGGELIFNKPPQPLTPEEEGLAKARRTIAGEIPNSPTPLEQLSKFPSLFEVGSK